MYLTDEEKRMLDGEYGYGPQIGMKILVAVGKVYDAEKMIPVHHAHVAGTGFKPSARSAWNGWRIWRKKAPRSESRPP